MDTSSHLSPAGSNGAAGSTTGAEHAAAVFESDIYRLPKSVMMRKLRARYGRKLLLGAGFCLLAIAIAAILTADPRIFVVGLMLSLLGWTMLSSLLYINHAITKSMLVNTTPHTVSLTDSSLIVRRLPEPAAETEADAEPKTGADAEPKTEAEPTDKPTEYPEIEFPLEIFTGLQVGLKGFTLIYPEPERKEKRAAERKGHREPEGKGHRAPERKGQRESERKEKRESKRKSAAVREGFLYIPYETLPPGAADTLHAALTEALKRSESSRAITMQKAAP